MKRKQEYFEPFELKHKTVISNPPKKLFPQERDWTCAIASLRTLMSGFLDKVSDEEYLLEKYALKPGPHYSKDIKSYHILDEYDVIYGCDNPDVDFDIILDRFTEGYFIMLQSMINYSHWTVLLGYYPSSENNPEMSKLLMYDPYYDEVRLFRVDEFISMWKDGDYENTHIEKEFIAVKSRSN